MMYNELKQCLSNGKLDDKLAKIYHNIAIQKTRYLKLLDMFNTQFGDNNDLHIFSTSGRTEICGNHTDHQNGKVLAAAVNLDIACIACKNSNNKIRVKSEGFTLDEVDIDDLSIKEDEKNTSKSLIRGIAYKIKELGYKIGGFDAYTSSEVLVGSGLSSSAAFEVLIGTIINGLFNEQRITMLDIAKIAQFAEREYFGKPSGLMDQTACAVGGVVMIDFKDNTNPIVKSVNFDLSKHGYKLVIVNTGADHADLTNEYAAIPKDMKAVARFMGSTLLEGVDEAEFFDNIKEARSQLDDRQILRAIHFFDENKRVEKIYDAILNDDIEGFLSVVKASGKSSYELLQNIYCPQNPKEQSVAFSLCMSERALGENGATRVHGGGFAGTIQAFVKEDEVGKYIDAMEKALGKGCCYLLCFRQEKSMMLL